MAEAAEAREVTSVQRRYVLKKPGMDPAGRDLSHFLAENFDLPDVTVTTGFRYDIQGLDAATFEEIIPTVLSEGPVNFVLTHDEYDANILDHSDDVQIEPLPGQYNQMADSAQQCITLETGKTATVCTAEVIIFDRKIPPNVLEEVKEYLINKTDSREASREMPRTLEAELLQQPGLIEAVEGFGELSDRSMRDLIQDLSLAMTLEDMRKVQAYFRSKNRNPLQTELKVIDTYWSDHCRHTTFTTLLKRIGLGGKTLVGERKEEISPEWSAAGRAIADALKQFLADRKALYGDAEKDHTLSLMDLALFSMREALAQGRLDDMVVSEEINAATTRVPVRFADGTTVEYDLLFKNETHNHPTEIEPIGGAETDMGGVIRDPLSGRVPVIMGMRVTGSGDPREPLASTLPGKLPQRRITTGAAIGFSRYGNQIGVPTLKVHEHYHPGFKAKRMEIGFVAGAAPSANIRRETPAPGDVVIVLGGATGRDGIGGASGSSKVHTQTSVATLGAEVQKGNAVTELHIQRLFANPQVTRLIKRCNDFGAGGASVAIGEIARGVCMNLDRLPKKYEGLDGTELAISESQERMAIVLSAEDAQAFIDAAAAENLEAVMVGEVTEEEVLRETWNGQTICELDRDFLEGGWAERSAEVEMKDPGEVRSFFTDTPADISGTTPTERWTSNLRRLCVASQRGLQQRFDSTVGANTIVGPFGGLQEATPSEAAVTAFPGEGALTKFATAEGYDPDLAVRSPFHGGMYAVIDSIAKLVATGASPAQVRLTLQNYFGKPTDPERWGDPLLMQLGARLAQKHLKAPAIGGKDSAAGTFVKDTGERLDVPPTLVSFAVGIMQDEPVISSAFQKAGSTVVHLQAPIDDAGIPDWEMMKQLWEKVHALQKSGSILSSQAVHTGGIAASLTTMSVGNRVGVQMTTCPSDAQLFSAQYGSMVIELAEGQDPHTLLAGLPMTVLGTTIEEEEIRFNEGDTSTCMNIRALQEQWEEPLESVFPIHPPERPEEVATKHKPYTVRNTSRKVVVGKPRVSVLAFPGTNCEMETARAFERAGGNAEVVLFLNRTQQNVRESIARLVQAIGQSEIVAFPGGFSAGDQPDGSAKYIASALRNPRIRDAMQEHIGRGGLVLGICNGFQALVKSGLLPNGQIRVQQPEDLTLTHNDMGRFLGMHTMHRVASVLSPWMSAFDPGELVDIPIAHGEGRVVQAPDSLWENGQVAFQYAGRDGKVCNSFPNNPNGSQQSVAGITDPTGKVLGMMGHLERAIEGRSVQIPTERKGHKLFEGGISYFS